MDFLIISWSTRASRIIPFVILSGFMKLNSDFSNVYSLLSVVNKLSKELETLSKILYFDEENAFEAMFSDLLLDKMLTKDN